jgi:hypothetical protein
MDGQSAQVTSKELTEKLFEASVRQGAEIVIDTVDGIIKASMSFKWIVLSIY